MKICPKCGSELDDYGGSYLCSGCGAGMFSEDEIIVVSCPKCGDELRSFCGDYYCYTCNCPVPKKDAVHSKSISFDEGYDFQEHDYDSMIDNGDNICLNCTYWSVSPYGSAHGMVCRRGYPTNGPGDSCSDFVQSSYFASYGDNGQYQFNETRQNTANKLYHWKNSR